MPTIRIQHPHTLGRDTAIQRMKQFEEMLAKYKARLEWQGNSAQIKGTGVGGDVQVSDNDVSVKVELGMLAKMAGIDPTKLEATIKKRLTEALG